MRARARRLRLNGVDADFPPEAAVQLVAVSKVFGRVFDTSAGAAEDPDDIVDDDESGDDEQQVTSGAAALDDVTLTIARGTFFGIAGPPAAGKTTLVRLIAGTLVPTSGEVRVRGRVAPPPETLGRLLEPGAAGAANLDLLARFLGLHERVTMVDLAAVYELAGLGGLEEEAFASIPRRHLAALLVSAVVHLSPDVYLFDPAPKIADPIVRAAVDELLVERVRAGAVVVQTAASPDVLPPATDSVARLSLGRLIALGPGARGAKGRHERVQPAADASLTGPGTDPLLLLRIDVKLDERPASIRVVVDVGVPRVEVVFGFIFRPRESRGSKLRSARYVLNAGCFEVVAYLGALSGAEGQCSLHVGALAGPEGQERAIMWPSPIEVDLGDGLSGGPHTAWRVDPLERSEMVQALAVAPHEAPEAEHEHEQRQDA
jgi:ABC-type polysaccharide/polyol phosphate transport system ATPase subunit